MKKAEFYVYEWFIKETGEVFYVGKGTGNRHSCTKRNKIFKDIVKQFECDYKILKNFENEQEAFEFEHLKILEYKNIGQCRANLDYGGKGGVHFAWTNEMKEYMSANNPMKDEKQRERMSKNNPMKNERSLKKMSEARKKPVLINGVRYDGIVDAQKVLGVAQQTIQYWMNRGYDAYGNLCLYEDEPQKDIAIGKISRRKVYIDEVLFQSLSEAAKYLNGSRTALLTCIKMGKKYKEHECWYADEHQEIPKKELL